MSTPRGTHDCPGGCGRAVPRHWFACPDCWFRLPLSLRQPISDTYRQDFGTHDVEAIKAALDQTAEGDAS